MNPGDAAGAVNKNAVEGEPQSSARGRKIIGLLFERSVDGAETRGDRVAVAITKVRP